jgi:GNAT superfamily N-acetyltransferase
MTMIEPLDPADDAQFAEFYAVYLAAFTDEWDRPYGSQELRVTLLEDSEFEQVVGFVGRDDAGAPVAVGTVEFTFKDNLDLGFLQIYVAPDRRREGHGTAMESHLAGIAREQRRTSLMGEARWDIGQPGHRAFAEARGYHLDLADGHRVLDLPATLPAAPVRDGYTLHHWRGRTPDEWVDQYAQLNALFVQEAPTGDHPIENEFYDAARVRADDQRLIDQGRVMQVVVAVAPEGELAGHTQLVFPGADPGDVYQWGTLVLPGHRGHGLGLSLKVRAMEVAGDLLEGRRYVHTGNALSNEPMIAVNDAMGYRLVAYSGEFVRSLAD